MCLAAKRSLQGRAAKLMLCGSAILSLFSCDGKQKFLHFIAVVSGFVALCLTVWGFARAGIFCRKSQPKPKATNIAKKLQRSIFAPLSQNPCYRQAYYRFIISIAFSNTSSLPFLIPSIPEVYCSSSSLY